MAGAGTGNALIVNGNFEDVSSSSPGRGLQNNALISDLATGPGASWDVFTSLPGWTTTSGAGIEVQTNRTLGSIDSRSGGQHYVELDSHRAQSNSTMEQTVTLGSGRYLLDFYFSPRTGDANSNGIRYEVMADQTVFGDVTGPSILQGTQQGLWTHFSQAFEVASDNTAVRILFGATGTEDTLGGFLDDISLTRIGDIVPAPPVPLPPAMLMLMSVLGGFGLFARRRRA